MRRFVEIAFAAFLAAGCAAKPSPAEMWLTTPDETQKLAPQRPQTPVGPASGDEAIKIDSSRHFQKMHGFGAAITDA